MPKKKRTTTAKKRGRPPRSLKIEGDWTKAVKVALRRGKPPKKSAQQGS